MKWMNQFTLGLIVALWWPFATVIAAPSYSIELEQPNNDVRDTASLQRGAVLFSNYCMACHSAEYMRFNRVARDLGWTDEEVVEKVAHGLNLPVDSLQTRIQLGVSEAVFGIKAPDLSLMARLKGNDYVYTFIRGYYEDEQGNWNNHVLAGTSMPNVLEGLKRHASAEEFDQATVDLVNFLDYLAEPYKVKRWDLGWKVVVFLLVLLLFTYLLKREYWRDIKH
ncbi:MAG: cytochrome c1 [Thiomicrospira sp.]|jgi:ubiquinol-cytochrome c reductase cytochrome c1 subunit|nr:cytochrome c1 [Thiomicrospira sp.]